MEPSMNALNPSTDATRTKTLRWVMAIVASALLVDGYDLVVYGTVVPSLLRDPSQIGALDPAQAGALGSYALMGVMVGALAAGAVGDFLGRRKLMLINIVWFSLGMAFTAMAASVPAFGLLRFLTGIGVGALVATAGAVVAEFAPAGKRNFYNAIVYSGVPAGGLLASLLAIVLNGIADWRGLFLIGALPLVSLFPLSLLKLPESPRGLFARGRTEQALSLSVKTGVPFEDSMSDGGPASAGPRTSVQPPPALRKDGRPCHFPYSSAQISVLACTTHPHRRRPLLPSRMGNLQRASFRRVECSISLRTVREDGLPVESVDAGRQEISTTRRTFGFNPSVRSDGSGGSFVRCRCR
jgi:AAHS family benzoate transporter-like MFS transporter